MHTASPWQPTRKEWAYNIHHGCERHCARDVDIRLFHDIVLGRVDDAIYATRVVETERCADLRAMCLKAGSCPCSIRVYGPIGG